MGLALIGSAGLINKASAQETTGSSNIQYPVAELGNCKSGPDCKIYCDKPVNTNACLDFAQKNNLMSDKEVAQAKKFVASGEKGPGGCVGKDSCEQYCNDISHIDECISYAEKNDIMSPQELEEAKKVQSAINKGVKPPACGNKKECDIYCEDQNHMEECINFGIAAGFIQGKELENSQKMLAAVKRGVKPPPCKGKEACDAYCSNPDNIEVCMNFAIEAGMMSEQEKANSGKMLQAIKKGIKPPPCKGQQECDTYCSLEEHAQECIDFSVAAGMMTEEEAQMARKTGGKGPGGCVGREACDAFCNNPDNQENCFNFAKDNGMIPEADLKRMEEGKQQMKQTLEQAPAETLECLKTEVGADMVEKMKNGVMPPKDIGDKMQNCFQKMGSPNGGEPGSGGMIPPAGQTGPGGCKTTEECKAYCESNPGECQKFQPGPGNVNPGEQGPEGTPSQQAGPGGCQSPEECQKFCQDNPDACKNFGPDNGDRQFAPGTGPGQCEGENCSQQQQNQMQPDQQQGQMIQGQPCQGENCQFGPLPEQQMQPGQELQPEQNFIPPTGPGAGGNFAPGDAVPQLQPERQGPEGTPQELAPGENPPPPPPPAPVASIINIDSFVGSLISAALQFLIGY